MTICTLILVALSAWILKPISEGPADRIPEGARDTPSFSPLPSPSSMVTKADILAIRGVRFGLSTPQAPWNAQELERISAAAGGVRPTMLQFFLKWCDTFQPQSIQQAYRLNALPIISWEPWRGEVYGESQPEYALSKIISGTFDQYLTEFATTIRDQRWPVALRLAHEMNGNWYPWSESKSGNKAGEYVKAWRHIHDIFTTVGANNVIWIWSPNIIRPVPKVSLSALYPGDDYVDWVGMVGYAKEESTAAAVYEPTINVIRPFCAKPIIITEAGAQPSDHKVTWIRDFFQWIETQQNVIGFNWFEYSEAEGGKLDWRFTENAQTKAAFAAGIKQVTLAAPPPR